MTTRRKIGTFPESDGNQLLCRREFYSWEILPSLFLLLIIIAPVWWPLFSQLNREKQFGLLCHAKCIACNLIVYSKGRLFYCFFARHKQSFWKGFNYQSQLLQWIYLVYSFCKSFLNSKFWRTCIKTVFKVQLGLNII